MNELRRQVIDRAMASGARLPVGRSGHNPMTLTYTSGAPSHFYVSLDAYRRDVEAGTVDPDFAGWGYTPPRTVHDWTGDECRDWLAQNS